MADTIVAAITGVLGVTFGSIGTYCIERFKRRGQINEARRKAYADWFTVVSRPFAKHDCHRNPVQAPEKKYRTSAMATTNTARPIPVKANATPIALKNLRCSFNVRASNQAKIYNFRLYFATVNDYLSAIAGPRPPAKKNKPTCRD
jgi:hypothetical protein